LNFEQLEVVARETDTLTNASRYRPTLFCCEVDCNWLREEMKSFSVGDGWNAWKEFFQFSEFGAAQIAMAVQMLLLVLC